MVTMSTSAQEDPLTRNVATISLLFAKIKKKNVQLEGIKKWLNIFM